MKKNQFNNVINILSIKILAYWNVTKMYQIKLCIITLASLILTGCSSAPQGKLPVDNNKENNGTIIVYNEKTKAKSIINTIITLHGLNYLSTVPYKKSQIIINDVSVGELNGYEPLVLPIKVGTHTYSRMHSILLDIKAKFTIEPKQTKYFYFSNVSGVLQLAETTKESFDKCANTNKFICIPDFVEFEEI